MKNSDHLIKSTTIICLFLLIIPVVSAHLPTVSPYGSDSLAGTISPLNDFSNFLPFFTLLLGITYLISGLRVFRNREWRNWYLPVLYQIPISVVVVLLGSIGSFIVGGYTTGPILPSIVDVVVFFEPQYILGSMGVGVASFLIAWGICSFFLMLLMENRHYIPLFYALTVTPFLFPVGPLLGLIHLIYIYRAGRPEGKTRSRIRRR